jgi:molybdopterin biosynthesis enzyme
MQGQSVNQVALLSCAEDRPGRTAPTAVEDVPRLVRDLVDVVEGVVPLPVVRSAGWTLATDLVAAEALPPFDQSAVDGFAFAGIPDADGAPFAGVVRAGDAMRPLPPGGALRVMTGAPVPFGADRVAMQEQCQGAGERSFRHRSRQAPTSAVAERTSLRVTFWRGPARGSTRATSRFSRHRAT